MPGLLLSTAVGFSQDHPCGSLSTWPRGGLKFPGLGLTCVGHPLGHLAFLGWCGSQVLGSLRACGVQSSRSSRLFRIFGRARLLLVVALILP